MQNLAISLEFARKTYLDQRRRRVVTLVSCFFMLVMAGVLLFMEGRSNARENMQERLESQVSVFESNINYGLLELNRVLRDSGSRLRDETALKAHLQQLSLKWPELVFVFEQTPDEQMRQHFPEHQYFGVPTLNNDMQSLSEQVVELPVGGNGLLLSFEEDAAGQELQLYMIYSLKGLVDRWLAGARATDVALRLTFKDKVVASIGDLSKVRISRAISSPFGEEQWKIILGIPNDAIGYLKFEWSSRLIATLSSLVLLAGWLLVNGMRRRDALELELGSYQYLIDTLSELVLEVDREFMIVYANKTAQKIFKLEPSELTQGISILQLMSPMSAHEFQQYIEHLRERSDSSMLTLQLQSTNNTLITCELNISPLLRKQQGECVGYRMVMRDVTERRRTDQRMKRLAHYDAMTDLPNRALCKDRLTQALARAQRNNYAVAVLYIDFDEFKKINEEFSVATGDAVIQASAERLLKMMRKSDTLARIAGDEFVLIAADILHHQNASKVAQRLGEHVLHELHRPFMVSEKPVKLSVSVGIAIYPRDANTYTDIMKYAHSAMFHAKVSGKGKVCFFTPEMRSVDAEKDLNHERLRHALEKDELELHYQASWNARENKICAAEALLRWNTPERGYVSPLEFIPQIDSAGLTDAMTEWVLLKAAKQFNEWREAGSDISYVALNLSAQQFASPNFLRTVEWVVNEMALPEKAIQLEVTEATLMEHGDVAASRLQNLASMGIRVAIDDFGSGYSSINFLKRLPVDEIKIDPTFSRDIEHGVKHQKAITAIVNLAESLGIAAVAEGVETQYQINFLKELGCDLMMGYGLSRPEDANAMTQRLVVGTIPKKITQR